MEGHEVVEHEVLFWCDIVVVSMPQCWSWT